MKPNQTPGAMPPIAVTLQALADLRRAADTGLSSRGDRRSEPVSRPTEEIKPLHILVVEGDPMIGPLLAEMLEELGHVVCAVEVNAADAVIAAKRWYPDLIIIDVGFGEASGIAAVRAILEEGFVPHVVVTGDLLRSLSLGPDAVLVQKPYRASDLVAAIAQAIGDGSSLEKGG
jgi:CheY-like chemotaxis protein